MKLMKEDKRRFNFAQVLRDTIDTSYIIALFMLITTGLPLIVPSVPAQVAIYGLGAVVLGFVKGKRK